MTSDEQRRAFEAVGRELLAGDLQMTADDLHTAMNKTASRVRNADELAEQDVRRVADALSRAEMVLDSLYNATPTAERPPRMAELMTREEVIEVTERSPLSPRDARDTERDTDG